METREKYNVRMGPCAGSEVLILSKPDGHVWLEGKTKWSKKEYVGRITDENVVWEAGEQGSYLSAADVLSAARRSSDED